MFLLYEGLDNRISKESEELGKLVDGERVERLKSTDDIKTSIQNEKEFLLNKLDEEKTVLQNDIAEVRADVEDTKETGNEDIEALKRLLEEEKEAREAGKISNSTRNGHHVFFPKKNIPSVDFPNGNL